MKFRESSAVLDLAEEDTSVAKLRTQLADSAERYQSIIEASDFGARDPYFYREWNVNRIPETGEVEVVETLWLHGLLEYGFLLLAFWSYLVWFITGLGFTPFLPYNPIQVLPWSLDGSTGPIVVFTVASITPLFVNSYNNNPSVIKKLNSQSNLKLYRFRRYDLLELLNILLILLSLSVLIYIEFDWWLPVAITAFLGISFTVISLVASKITIQLTRKLGFWLRIPSTLLISHLRVLSFISLPPAVGLFSYYYSYNINVDWGVFRSLAPLMLSVAVTGPVLAFLISKFDNDAFNEMQSEYHNSRKSSRNSLTLLLASLASYTCILLYVLYVYLFIEMDILNHDSTWFLLVLSLIPVTLWMAGFLYQIANSLAWFTYAFANIVPIREIKAEKADTVAEFNIGAPVYVLPSESATATSYYWGSEGRIVISSELIDLLEAEELAALVAHEEAHILNNDTLLISVGKILSPIFLVGQNLVYSIFDFYQRELDADQTAAEKIGADHLISGLETIEEETPKKGGLTTPTHPLSDDIGLFQAIFLRIFGEMFGAFALTAAHPSIETRKQELRKIFKS